MKKFKAFIFILFFIIGSLFVNILVVEAHTNILNVEYEPCDSNIDGEDEIWYYNYYVFDPELNNQLNK